MDLPKRPAFYIMTLLLVILVALVVYLTQAVTSPELLDAVQRAKARQSRAESNSGH